MYEALYVKNCQQLSKSEKYSIHDISIRKYERPLFYSQWHFVTIRDQTLSFSECHFNHK